MGKLVKFKQLARIAAAAADRSVQDRRFILNTYKSTKALTRDIGFFKRQTPSREKFIEMLGKPADPLRQGFASKMSAYLRQGEKGLNREVKNRARAGKALAQATAKPDSGVNRMVNAHGKGIVFRRVGGRIVPIRKK